MKYSLLAVGELLLLSDSATAAPEFNNGYTPEKWYQVRFVSGKVTGDKGQTLANTMEDVVIVGYGTQRKANPTGSIAMVNGAMLTQAELRDYIHPKRRAKFAFESQRYNDLKRWNLAHVKLPMLSIPAGKPLVFESKNYRLPFQQSELDNNPQLIQNDGY